MSWFSWEKPKIKVQTTKKGGFSGWLKCTCCQELIHLHALEKNLYCCPQCNYHYRLSVEKRIQFLTDQGTFQEKYAEYTSDDPLQFLDTKSYRKRLAEAKGEAKKNEAITVGSCRIEGIKTAIALLDFHFMAGSMGSVVGEKLVLLIEYAMQQSLPLVIVSASGGARMQESTFSLMQMVKTSATLGKFARTRLPYISLLTNPTCGGVTASFASLGDLIFAEPDALVCFTGPRIIQQTIGEKMPKGAQKPEFLLNHGMIDRIVERKQMKKVFANCLRLLMARNVVLC